METCDISLLKQEIVELIKTEPQNEDEFDTCGQSGIKTEDSNLAGDFKDTIVYEAQSFQNSEVEMKSLWDGFLPIKEQIKDESDTSNSVDEIVKTEIKLFDSSFGILDSNIDHFTPLDKYESKLEQDQSTMSSVLLQSNTLAQTSCAFNLNIGCVNENQDLSFNALHKKAEHRKLLPKILCHEVKENVTLEYKKSFLNSYRTNYVKEHQNLFNEGVYKIQACSDSHLTFGEFKDNIEIIMISSTHPKLEGFFVSTEATDTKCNLENYTKKGGNCIAHGDKSICKTKNCINKIQSGGYCIAHVVGRKCHTNNCTKYALQGGNCFSHGGGIKCKTENCVKKAKVGGHCIAHGGRIKCKTTNCNKYAQRGGNCFAHGGGRKCKSENCTKYALERGHCFAHGGGRICKSENCTKKSYLGGVCKAHGGGRKCKTENCVKKAKVGGHCIAHGGGRICNSENCTKKSHLGGVCIAHGGGRKCKSENCNKLARIGGFCKAHGGGRKCKIEDCMKWVYVGGRCYEHREKKKCKTGNCSKYARKGGVCFTHGRG